MIETKGDRYGSAWSERYVSTQPKPYIKPLFYRSYGVSHSVFGPRLPQTAIDLANHYPLANRYDLDAKGGVVAAKNKALSKVYDKLSQSEALLVAWKERQSALDLVTSNVGRLVRTARAIKRRDPRIVRAIKKRNPRGYDVASDPAGLWLEYHFAIVPTISDIHHALGLLGFEFPVEKFSCSSGNETIEHKPAGDQHWTFGRSYTFKTRVKIGGEIYAINPNVHLATMLGFGQPLSVAWEMTPFSWFVDYFVNVGDLLKNMEPRFPSIKTRNHYTTTYTTCEGYISYNDNGRYYNGSSWVWGGPLPAYVGQFKSWNLERVTSWPSFQLELNSPLSLKGQQASYIVAVLTGILSSFVK